MKVKELIEKLKTLAPEREVFISGAPDDDYAFWCLETVRETQIVIDETGYGIDPDEYESLPETPVVVLEKL